MLFDGRSADNPIAGRNRECSSGSAQLQTAWRTPLGGIRIIVVSGCTALRLNSTRRRICGRETCAKRKNPNEMKLIVSDMENTTRNSRASGRIGRDGDVDKQATLQRAGRPSTGGIKRALVRFVRRTTREDRMKNGTEKAKPGTDFGMFSDR